jgi:hypothetical protein
MKKLLLLLFTLSSISYAEFTNDDFAIQLPKADKAIAQGGPQVAIFFLPPMDNFQANVNIQKQAFKGTIEQYKNISLAQFEKMKFTLVKESLLNGVLTVEYTGNMQNRDFHWYVKATKKGDSVYLVTGVAPQRTWQYQGDTLRSSVDSFKLK